MVARNDLTVLNTGREMTFRRGARRTIIDLMIVAARLALGICDWCEFEVTTLSNHQCIEFCILARSHPLNTGRGGKTWNPSWNTKRLSKDKLREYLEETRIVDGLCWAKSAGSLGDTMQAMRQKVVAACDHSMPRLGHRCTKKSMYWWNDQLAVTRRVIPKTGPKFLHGRVR